jgi:hypothetical protein
MKTTATPHQRIDTIKNEFQIMLDDWEGYLKATGGAIEPRDDKSWYYSIDFKWTGQSWLYKTREEIPADITMIDPDGKRVPLQRHEPDHAELTLGYYLSMDGNETQEVRYLTRQVEEFSSQARTGDLSKSEFWRACTTTIWKQLEYAMPPSTITERQWNIILKPLHKHWLPRTGIARTFPHDILYGPKSLQGLGLMHPYYQQELGHIATTIDQVNEATELGQYVVIAYENLQLELGLPGPITAHDYKDWSTSTTHTWLHSWWEFCSSTNLIVMTTP